MLKAGFQKCHRQPQHRLPLRCELQGLLVAASADSFWCSLRHPKCDQAMHIALPPSPCNPVLSSILTHNNTVGLCLETWLANCWDRYVPSIAQGNDSSGISNFIWRMRRSSACWKYIWPHLLKIQRHILQKSGQFLLQKFEVCLTCKTTFQDERTNQLIVQNCTPHIDTKT